MPSRAHEKIYTGRRDKNGVCVVHVQRKGESYLLPPRLDLANHSPTGFEWGYGGSGPAQLALAILADCVSDEIALALHQEFKRKFIAPLPRRSLPWCIRDAAVVQFVLDHMKPLDERPKPRSVKDDESSDR